MSALCVIPARGGSKRIVRKNILAFAGKPMLAHALCCGLESGVFDQVHVSTDYVEIAAVASDYGAEPVFMRPPELADDFTPIRDVVRHDLAAFKRRGHDFTTVALVYATAALITPSDLRSAMAAFLEDKSTPLLGVVRAQTPLERLMVVQDGVLVPAVSAQRFANRTQDLTTVYRDAGAFALFDAETVLEDRDGAAAMAFRPYVLPPWKAVDIDTEEDWHHAEIIKAGLDALGG